jgi:hypothetical protein
MAIKFRKNAIKFLEKANIEDTAKIHSSTQPTPDCC